MGAAVSIDEYQRLYVCDGGVGVVGGGVSRGQGDG